MERSPALKATIEKIEREEMEAKLFRTIAPGEETGGVTSRNEKKFGH